jgi:putative heme-binding domain-containing protein
MAFISQMLAILLAAMMIGGHAAQDPIAKLTTSDLARGNKLFVAHCALCHGIGGTGDRGPSLNQPELRRAADNQALVHIIQNGIEGTEMPEAWQLTDREIKQVAGYVRSLGRTTAVTKLPGNPVKGKQYYDSKGGCAACHIVSGKGGNIGPDLSDVGAQRSASYLREALIDPGAAVPEGFLVVSVVTRDGRKLRGTRSNEDSFTIQLRDASNTFHSFRKVDLTDLRKEFGASMMPAYREALTPSEIDDLVAYLAGLRGEK